MSRNKFPDLAVNYTEHLPKSLDANILDFGCGDGRVCEFLITQKYSNITATDIDSELLENVKVRLNINTLTIADFESQKINLEGSFDLIVAKDVIYYLSNSEIISLLESFQKLLKPDGILLVEVFNGSALTGPYVMYKDLGITTVFTEHSLIQLLENANFELLTIAGNKFPINGIKSIVFSFIQFLWRKILGLLYFLERGLDEQNPKILNRKIILTAISK